MEVPSCSLKREAASRPYRDHLALQILRSQLLGSRRIARAVEALPFSKPMDRRAGQEEGAVLVSLAFSTAFKLVAWLHIRAFSPRRVF